ncbi:MAG: MFS transporter [Dehalococcoidia bacterium]|nr:MFS transporter [Dehalococcoidia bacterium]
MENWKRNLYSIWAVVFISMVGGSLVFPFMPFYMQEDLGVDDPGEAAFWTGIAMAATGVSMFVFSPVWGSLADRHGRRPMLIRAVIGGMILISLQGLAQNVWQLILLRGLQGAFMGIVGASAALVASSTPPREMGYAMGLIQSARFSSQTVGPVIGGALALAIGFRETFIFTAGLYGLGLFMVVFLVREEFTPEPEPEGGRRGLFSMQRDIAAVAAVPALFAVIVIYYFLFASNAFVRPVLPVVLQDINPDANLELEAGFAFGMLAVASAVSSILVGRAAGIVGYRLALAASTVGAGLCYLPMILVGSFAQLLLLMAAIGLFSGGMLAAASALIGTLAPPGRQGAAFGLSTSAQALALATAPIAGGITASSLGVRSGFVIAACVLVAVGAAAWLAIRVPGHDSELEAVPRATSPPA